MYSTGHGSIANSPDGSQSYYVHHGRPSATGGPRKLYTERLSAQVTSPDANGNPTLVVDQTTSDRPGTVTPDADSQGATVTLSGKGAALLTLAYQRQKA